MSSFPQAHKCSQDVNQREVFQANNNIYRSCLLSLLTNLEVEVNIPSIEQANRVPFLSFKYLKFLNFARLTMECYERKIQFILVIQVCNVNSHIFVHKIFCFRHKSFHIAQEIALSLKLHLHLNHYSRSPSLLLIQQHTRLLSFLCPKLIFLYISSRPMPLTCSSLYSIILSYLVLFERAYS